MKTFKWKKLGRVFNPCDITDIPWMKNFAQAPATLLFDDFVRVYFSSRPPTDENGQFVSYGAYVDLDINNLFEIKQVSKNPIMPLGAKGTFDEFGTYPISVIRDGKDVIAYYGGWTRCESVPFDVAIGKAISNDNGQTFKKIGTGPVIAAAFNEPFILSGPKIRRFNDQWFLYYIAGQEWISTSGRPEPVYRISMATSTDGVNWVRRHEPIIDVKVEERECQASPDVIYSNGMYHMFFCYRYSTDYKNKANSYRIGYAHSKDLITWTRDDDKVGIDVSAAGWDSEMISYPHVFELKDKMYMLYLGNNFGCEGFGLAELEGHL